MRWITALASIVLAFIPIFGQSDIQKLIDTEQAFAQLAADKDTKTAFLENLADDGVIFNPEKINAKAFWSAQGESKSLLSWAPNYADISSNGILGYTTGNWEFRSKGKDDTPSAFGEFITVWLRQPNGKYKFVVDIGVNHEKPAKYSSDWTTSADKMKDLNEKNLSAADSANSFFETASKLGLKKAYEAYSADDVRVYREDNFPVLGKKNLIAIAEVKKEKTKVAFAKRSVFFGSANIAYIVNAYTKTDSGKMVEKGNFVQIWKLKQGRWQIVLDIFKPVPEKARQVS